MSEQTQTRRLDLDWLRVLAILTVFVFHSGRFFDAYPWHVKNGVQFAAMSTWSSFLVSWLMPLVFVVSGASVYYALGKRGAAHFLSERTMRLLIPLVVAIFTHAALQVYLERLSYGQFRGSFWEFYPHYFTGLYQGEGRNNGNFALFGMHLWYLLVLFVFSVVSLPLLLWLKQPGGQRLYTRIGKLLAQPGMLYLLALPIGAALLLDQRTIYGGRFFGGWNLVAHLQFFLYGFVVATHSATRQTIERWRWLSLGLGLLLTGTALVLDSGLLQLPGTLIERVKLLVFGFSAWPWILAIMGWSFRHLNVAHPWLNRLNEAVMPFYVMHQTVLLVVGFFVVRVGLAAPLKFLIISATSFVLIVAAYELLIRRFNLLRILFGMKPLPRHAVTTPRPQLSGTRG